MSDYFTNTAIDIRIDPAPEDIQADDTVFILYRRPNGTHGEWTAAKFGALIRYVTAPADVQTAGTWQLQACTVKNGVRKEGKYCYLTIKTPLN